MAQKLDFIDFDNLNRGIDYSDLTDKSYKEKLLDGLKNSVSGVVWFLCLLLYLETVFHVWAFHGLSVYFFLKLLLCIPNAVVLAALVSYFPAKVNRIVNIVVSVLLMILFVVNILYRAIFKVFFSLGLVNKTNMKFVQYYREIIDGIIHNWFVLVLTLIVPIAVLVLLYVFKILQLKKISAKCIYIHAAYYLVAFGLVLVIVPLCNKGTYSAYELMNKEMVNEYAVEKIGVTVTHEIELRNKIAPRKLDFDEDLTVWVYDPSKNQNATSTSTASSATAGEPSDDPGVNPDDPTVIQDIVKEIDRSPNMLDIDFVSLSENEKDENIAAIHKYFASVEPSYKNEYTGMFKGFNLIFMTAEAFSSLAVDKELTPTLYRLVNEGFVFDNFYNPRTDGSTSDGEFVCSTSLVSANAGTTNFRICGQNSMPFSLGNLYNRTYGITSKAYHDHTWNYYGRDITYPSMGYYYKGIGNGLDMPYHWPSSDLDMMKASIPEYIDDEIFNVYYMTVSGHLNYNFTGNYCAKIHQNDVANLPYSDGPKAYIACNMELDRALEYLINQLEEKGIADRTVICFTGDHWPYGLSNQEISEMIGHPVEEHFELYKSNLILWSGAIKEPIHISKRCCSMDILPTLLNLLGFEYDSRLLMGRDILDPNTEGFIIFRTARDLMTDKITSVASSGKVTNLTDEEVTDEYIKTVRAKLRSQFTYSKAIMDYDYYKYIADYLGIEVNIPEQNYIPDYARFKKK